MADSADRIAYMITRFANLNRVTNLAYECLEEDDYAELERREEYCGSELARMLGERKEFPGDLEIPGIATTYRRTLTGSYNGYTVYILYLGDVCVPGTDKNKDLVKDCASKQLARVGLPGFVEVDGGPGGSIRGFKIHLYTRN